MHKTLIMFTSDRFVIHSTSYQTNRQEEDLRVDDDQEVEIRDNSAAAAPSPPADVDDDY